MKVTSRVAVIDLLSKFVLRVEVTSGKKHACLWQHDVTQYCEQRRLKTALSFKKVL